MVDHLLQHRCRSSSKRLQRRTSRYHRIKSHNCAQRRVWSVRRLDRFRLCRRPSPPIGSKGSSRTAVGELNHLKMKKRKMSPSIAFAGNYLATGNSLVPTPTTKVQNAKQKQPFCAGNNWLVADSRESQTNAACCLRFHFTRTNTKCMHVMLAINSMSIVSWISRGRETRIRKQGGFHGNTHWQWDEMVICGCEQGQKQSCQRGQVPDGVLARLNDRKVCARHHNTTMPLLASKLYSNLCTVCSTITGLQQDVLA